MGYKLYTIFTQGFWTGLYGSPALMSYVPRSLETEGPLDLVDMLRFAHPLGGGSVMGSESCSQKADLVPVQIETHMASHTSFGVISSYSTDVFGAMCNSGKASAFANSADPALCHSLAVTCAFILSA